MAALAAGQRVLDIGSGSGDTALRAAGSVGPSGSVLAIDIDPGALARLAERQSALVDPHTARITMRVAAAEDLALDPGSFDVTLARNCLMYFRDLDVALRNVRGALRPGGRLVASVYGPLVREPFHAIPITAVVLRRAIPEPAPEYVRAFRLGAAAAARAFGEAGFRDVQQQVVATSRTYRSVSAALETLQDSSSLGELLSILSPSERHDAWDEIIEELRALATPQGLKIPGEQVVLSGVA
jgi:SAM-dependent methyltransferase